MSYTIIPDKASGDTFLEANWDTSIKDNMNTGLWHPLGDVLLSAAQSSIDFSGIPQTLAHLCILAFTRSDSAVAANELRVKFNNDSGNNYDHEQYIGTGTTVTIAESLTTSGCLIGAHPAASAVANAMGGTIAFIPYYTNTANNKCTYSWCTFKDSTSTGGIDFRMIVGAWRSNSAISTVSVFSNGDNLIAPTRVILYGMGN